MDKEKKLKAIKKELKARQKKALKDRDFDAYEKAKSESEIFEKIMKDNESLALAFEQLLEN
jgi:hypothetical protein